ncbi:MAG: hypothetical protein NVS4B8_11830 [Herpetosiphon sp.]
MMGVEYNQEHVIMQVAPACIPLVHNDTVQQHAEAAYRPTLPFVIRHFLAIGAIPLEVAYLEAMNAAALEEVAPMEYRVLLTELD